MLKRVFSLIVMLSLPAAAWAQTAPASAPPPPPIVVAPTSEPPPPPPPSYPPAEPARTQPNLVPTNLQPYSPIVQPAPAKEDSQHELGLMAGEFFASAAVTTAATVAVLSAIGSTETTSQQATAEIVSLLYIALIPAVSSLPVWLIGMLSDRYDVRIGPAMEAGSAISGVAVIIYLIASEVDPNGNSTNTWKYAAGGALIIAMPLAEVIATNVTKTPKSAAIGPLSAPILPEVPQRFAAAASTPLPGTVMLGLPAVSF
ncbi:MAG: hypothetical protein JST54_06055 [Deltaproteobacteria bacterium]|nr:hypothetical protein [Deltaproteobacteria bacterium]